MCPSVPSEELYRKLLHGLVIVLPIGIFYSPDYFDFDRWSVCFFTLGILGVSLLVEGFRFRSNAFGVWYFKTFGSMLRVEEKDQLTGATYIAGACLFSSSLSLISEQLAACAFLGLTLFILGDAIAALVGKSIGRTKVGSKTMEGALANFLLCFILTFWVFPELPDFLTKLGSELTVFKALLISFSVALFELFPLRLGSWKLNDNLYVPVLVSWVTFLLS